jgi:hypothetical protein
MAYNIVGSGYNYLGVTSITPPNLQIEVNAPTANDLNANIGDFWFQKDTQNLWFLTSQADQVAVWTPIAAAETTITFTTDVGDCTSVAAIMQTPGGANMNTAGAGNTYTINLDTSILQPTTTADGLNGVYALGVTDYTTDRFMHAYGSDNAFLGNQAGNLALTSVNSVGIGSGSLNSVISSDNNVAVGYTSLVALLSGDGGNVALGSQSLNGLETGAYNLGIGNGAGANYFNAESNNILLNSQGVSDDTNTLRIGQATGGDTLELQNAYIQGIYDQPVNANQQFVIISDDGKLGSVMGGGGGGGASTFVTDDGNAIEDAGVLEIIGGINLNTSGSDNIVIVDLDTSIKQPHTNNTGSEGIYALGNDIVDDRFLHNYGDDNTFLGAASGNLTLTGSNNVTAGFQTLTSATSSADAVAIGYLSQASVTSGVSNTSAGSESLSSLVDGNYNLSLGYQSGVNLNSSQSSNIYLSNQGNVLDNHVMRLGTSGMGANQVNEAYVAGTYGRAIGSTAGVVLIDNADKVGSSNGANGELLIGGGTGPVWANITSNDNSVTIANGANSIDLSVPGGGLGGTVYITTTVAETPVYSADLFQVPNDTNGFLVLKWVALGKFTSGPATGNFINSWGNEDLTIRRLGSGAISFNSTGNGYNRATAGNTAVLGPVNLSDVQSMIAAGIDPTYVRIGAVGPIGAYGNTTIYWKIEYNYFLYTNPAP